MSEQTFDRIAHDLKVVACLREGDRIYVLDGALHVLQPTIISSIYRWSRGDNRRKSLAALNQVFSDALTLVDYTLEKIKNNPSDGLHIGIAKRAYFEIQKALLGIRTLRTTYMDDLSILASVDVIREKTLLRLTAISTLLNIKEESSCIFALVDADDGDKINFTMIKCE